MQCRLLAGKACITLSLAHSMSYVEGDNGGKVPVGLGSPPAPSPFPWLLLRVLCSAQ